MIFSTRFISSGGAFGYFDNWLNLEYAGLPVSSITDLHNTLVVSKRLGNILTVEVLFAPNGSDPNTPHNIPVVKFAERIYFDPGFAASYSEYGIDLLGIEITGDTFAVTILGEGTQFSLSNLDVFEQSLLDAGVDPENVSPVISALDGVSSAISDAVEWGESQNVDEINASDMDSAINVNLETNTAIALGNGTPVDIGNIRYVSGTIYDDTVIGSGEDNILRGNEGADTLTGGAGHDDLYGGIGNDTIHGDDGAEILYDRGADDGIREGETTEEYLTRLYAYDGDGNDTLEGGDGADVLVYSGGTDTFTGGAGDDTYFVVPDAQTSTNPNDQLTINVSGDFGHDAVVGTGAGIKEIVFDGLNSSDVTIRYHFEKILLGTGDAESDNLFDWAHGTPGFDLGSFIMYKLAGSIEIIDGVTGSSFFVQDVYGSFLDGIGSIQNLSHIDTQFDLVFSNETITNWATLIDKDADFNFINTELRDTADDALESFADERARIDNPTDTPPPPADPNGTENDDILSGGDTAELFIGLGGMDTISAGGGNDILVGGQGSDALDGGEGFDFASYKDATSGVIVRLTTGIGTAGDADGDTLVNIEGLVGSEFADQLTTALSGGVLFGLGGDDTLRGSGYFSGGDGNDVLIVTPGAPGTTMFGDAGDDILSGGHGTDLMFGGEGDDILDPGFGGNNTDDQLYGGNGNDTVTFDKVQFQRGVTVDLATGAATIEGRSGSIALDSIENAKGTIQDDTISGNLDANVLDGKTGNDILLGQGGDDTLNGGAHDDILDGGDGDDQLYGDAGNDTIYGGTGIDTAHFSLNQADYTFSWANGFIAVANGAGETDLIGNDVEFFNFAGNIVAYYDIYQTLPGVLLANDDSATVTESETVIIDVFANDQIPAGVTPTVTEIAGHAVSVWDTVTISPGVKVTLLENGFIQVDPNGQYDNLIDGETYTGHIEYKISDGAGAVDNGTISVIVEGETNPVVGGPTTIEGTAGSDTINGTNRSETINAGAGNDFIYAGGGNDTIYGGAGDDMMIGYGGQDSFDGGEGSDTVNYSYTDIFLEIDLVRGGATATVGGAIAETFASIENVIGTDGNNNIFGDGGANILSGRGGNDDIRGKGGDDVLDGGAGDDTLSGGDGNDLIYAGTGGDSFDGGAGIDTLDFSYTSLDLVFDMVAGTLSYGSSSETATGFENGIGGAGDDTLIGTDGVNSLDGGAGSDTLIGGAGNDKILGGLGSDTAIINVAYADATISTSEGFLIVTSAADGIDQISNDVEFITFTDGTHAFADLFGAVASNTPPVATDDLVTVVEDAVQDIEVLSNDSDADGDTLAISQIEGQAVSVGSILTLTSGATVELLADGSLRFDQNGAFDALNTGETSLETISYTVSDGQGGTDTASVTITIQGADETAGGAGIVDGTAGDDTINTSYAGDPEGDVVHNDAQISDLVYGNGGNDSIYLGRGNDTAHGGAGDDVIYGQNGNNTIYGDDGNDRLNTGSRSSTLDGGAGNDILQAVLSKGGDHTLTGGTGADTFEFLYNNSAKSSDAHITDFEVGVDTLLIGGQDFATLDPAALPAGYSLSAAGDGSLVISFDGSDTITIDGVTQSQFWIV